MAGQLIRRGPRTFLLRVYTGRDSSGKRRYHNETFRGTKKEADSKLAELVTQRDKGRLLARPKATVDEYLDAWLETTVKPSVRARTHHSYAETLKLYVRPYLGPVKLKAVTPVEVRGMLAKLTDKGLAPRTVRKAHECLRNALEQAVSDRLISENPARSRLVRKALPAKEQRDRTVIGAEQLADFLEAARDHPLYAYWLVLLFGGLRPGEALALRWKDVTGDTVSIRRVLVDKHGLPLQYAPPKSKKSRRAVPLPKIAVDALRAHRKRQAAEQLASPTWTDTPEHQGLIFTNEQGEPLHQYQTHDAFKDVLAAAGLPSMRTYDLRHSAAVLLLEAGEDLKVVSERLGHSTIALTADVYAHVTPGMQKRAVAKLDRLVGEGGS